MEDWAQIAKIEFKVSALDLNRLLSFREFDESPDNSFLTTMIQLYLESSPPELSALISAVHAKDDLQIYKLAHSLKSSSANLGANKIAEKFEAIENEHYPKNKTRTLNIESCLVGLEAEFRLVCRELEIVQHLVQGKPLPQHLRPTS